MRRRPVERIRLARPLLQRRSECRDCHFQPRRPALPLAEPPKRKAEIVLRHRPVERNPLAWIFRQGASVGLDGVAQRGVVAALVALAIESVSLAQQVPAARARMSTWNIAGRPTKQVGGLLIASLGQRDIALDGSRTRRAKHLRVLGRLRLLLELARLLRSCDLCLRRLAQQLVSALEMARVDLGLGLIDERSRRRIVWLQCGDLSLQPLVVAGDFGQRLGQLVVRNVRIFTDDLQQALGGVLGHAERLANLRDAVEQGAGRALHRRFDRLFELLGRQPERDLSEIAPDNVASD